MERDKSPKGKEVRIMMNKMNTSIAYGRDGKVYLTNIENETVTDLISVPCPEWGDRRMIGEMVKAIARERDLY